MLHTDLIAPVPELLRRHAAARGRKVAYRDAHGAVTYGDLLERTGRLAGHLADLGIAAGDAVAMLLPSSIYRSSLGPTPTDRFRIGFGRTYTRDGLEAMRLAAFASRLWEDAEDADWLGTAETVRLATQGSSKLLGLDGGSIEINRRARIGCSGASASSA